MLETAWKWVQNRLERINIEENVIIKSDIEGSEYEVIDQILKFSNRINMLIFEFHWIYKADKTKYIGQFKDGKFEGQGTYTYGDGTKYIGEFKDGLPNGRGLTLMAMEQNTLDNLKMAKELTNWELIYLLLKKKFFLIL